MEHGDSLRLRNTADTGHVSPSNEQTSACHLDLEDPITASTSTTSSPAASPVTMPHLEQFTDGDWVEPSDELTGTAVFDATGDKAAMPSWDELVRQHADRVYRLAYRLSGNQHDAEDAMQDALVAAWRAIGNFRGDAQLSTWLYRIGSNAALARIRKRTDADDIVAYYGITKSV